MESMLIGSFPKPLSFPVVSEVSASKTTATLALLQYSCVDVAKIEMVYNFDDLSCDSCAEVPRMWPAKENEKAQGVPFPRCRVQNMLEKYHTVKLQRGLVAQHVARNNEISSAYQSRSAKHIANAASSQPLESEPGAYHPKNPWESMQDALNAFYRFSRPHTVIGTALSISSVSLLAVEKLSDFSPLFFTGVLEAIVAALLMNVYIVGLNQLSDIEIDKVNKPYLPLASGEYSVTTGVMIVSSFAVLSFWLGWIVGSWPLFWALFISFMLGTAYSINVPLLRWKRFALVAAMCILAVRAVIVQIAFFLHIQTYVFGRPAVLSRPVIFATAFMSFFSVVIALFKNLDPKLLLFGKIIAAAVVSSLYLDFSFCSC
ncbi:hypothetical protein RHMOL_Rhmol03G0292200 [Rhododendron molle]|uniref:Uncharacterized protein n=1 Tax=Rhododendron molle TaxID=49168 RepID=A0ACC0PM16_RHOML|nr:hypothetical protein RHMOL_Rhmol03G0292200 [Rhododendron molle]